MITSNRPGGPPPDVTEKGIATGGGPKVPPPQPNRATINLDRKDRRRTMIEDLFFKIQQALNLVGSAGPSSIHSTLESINEGLRDSVKNGSIAEGFADATQTPLSANLATQFTESFLTVYARHVASAEVHIARYGRTYYGNVGMVTEIKPPTYQIPGHVYKGPSDARQTADTELKVSRFRKQYKALTPEKKALHDAIKDKAAELEDLIEQTPDGRDKSLAMTHLEDSVMRAIRGLTG